MSLKQETPILQVGDEVTHISHGKTPLTIVDISSDRSLAKVESTELKIKDVLYLSELAFRAGRMVGRQYKEG